MGTGRGRDDAGIRCARRCREGHAEFQRQLLSEREGAFDRIGMRIGMGIVARGGMFILPNQVDRPTC